MDYSAEDSLPDDVAMETVGQTYQQRLHTLVEAYEIYAEGFTKAVSFLKELRTSCQFQVYIKQTEGMLSIEDFLLWPLKVGNLNYRGGEHDMWWHEAEGIPFGTKKGFNSQAFFLFHQQHFDDLVDSLTEVLRLTSPGHHDFDSLTEVTQGQWLPAHDIPVNSFNSELPAGHLFFDWQPGLLANQGTAVNSGSCWMRT